MDWVHERLLELYRKLLEAMPDVLSEIETPTPGNLIDVMADVARHSGRYSSR